MAKKKETKEIAIKLTPQQLQFLGFYTNPSSETFGNRYQSALRAKYSAEYAESICSKGNKWLEQYLSEFGGDLKRLEKAEKVFDTVLDLDHVEDAIGAFGVIMNKETNKPYKKVNTQILKEKVNVSKFMGETIGRNKYSKKIEVVGSFSSSDLKEYD